MNEQLPPPEEPKSSRVPQVPPEQWPFDEGHRDFAISIYRSPEIIESERANQIKRDKKYRQALVEDRDFFFNKNGVKIPRVTQGGQIVYPPEVKIRGFLTFVKGLIALGSATVIALALSQGAEQVIEYSGSKVNLKMENRSTGKFVITDNSLQDVEMSNGVNVSSRFEIPETALEVRVISDREITDNNLTRVIAFENNSDQPITVTAKDSKTSTNFVIEPKSKYLLTKPYNREDDDLIFALKQPSSGLEMAFGYFKGEISDEQETAKQFFDTKRSLKSKPDMFIPQSNQEFSNYGETGNALVEGDVSASGNISLSDLSKGPIVVVLPEELQNPKSSEKSQVLPEDNISVGGEGVLKTVELKIDLRDTDQRGEFTLSYQPMSDFARVATTGYRISGTIVSESGNVLGEFDHTSKRNLGGGDNISKIISSEQSGQYDIKFDLEYINQMMSKEGSSLVVLKIIIFDEESNKPPLIIIN